MNSGDQTIERVKGFVEEALRWLPSEPINKVNVPHSAEHSMAGCPRASVLLVEDNADMRDYIHGLLNESFDVTAVANGQLALDDLHRSRPDLVLSDVMMPVLDGFELLRTIRSDPMLRDIPVILLSARASEEDRIDGLDTGADDYITKPFSAQELRARVRASLSLARMRHEAIQAVLDSEKKVQLLNEHLEARIEAEVQTHKAALTRLAEAEKTAALGRLAAGMAHDFNNLLQVVSSYARRIQEKSSDVAAVERMAKVVEEAASRGHSVTQRLLVFARQDGSRPEAVDIRSLLNGLGEVMADTLGTQVVLALELAEGLPLVLVDRRQLETVLINIATNAGDAMPDGGTLTFSAQPEMMTDMNVEHVSAGSYLRLSARDTGEGMDAATLARVTEPFFTTKQVGKGTGLGLSMANSFPEDSDGALQIVSVAGQGTTVTLLLPSTYFKDAAGPAYRDQSKAATGAQRSRVLLVDDDMRVRDTLAELLDDAGYHVIQVGDANAALDVIKTGPTVDLIISDLSMPGLDGISLIRAAQNRRPDLPAVLLTGHVSDTDLYELGGSFSLLRKPVNGRALTDKVSSILTMVENGIPPQ